MRVKTNIFLGIVLFYILYTVLPAVSMLLNLPVWLPSIIVSSLIFILFPQVLFKSSTLYWFLLYCLVTAVFMYFGRALKLDIGTSTQFYQLLIEYSFFLPNITIALVLLYLDDVHLYKLLFSCTIIALLISYLLIIPQLQQTDLRALAIAIEEGRSMQTLNNFGYTLLHAYVIILPAIFCYITIKNRLLKTFFIVFTLLTLYIIVKSSITTTIIISVLLLALSLLYNNDKTLLFIRIVLLAFIVLLLYWIGVVSSFVDTIIPFFTDTAVEQKLIDIKSSLIQQKIVGGTLTGRQNYHTLSWRSFFSNIIIGGGRFGGHSSLIDRLACMGLVGFVPYIMIYITIVKRWISIVVNRKARYYYYLGIFAVIILLYSKGLFGQEGNLFLMVLLPVFIIYIQNKE